MGFMTSCESARKEQISWSAKLTEYRWVCPPTILQGESIMASASIFAAKGRKMRIAYIAHESATTPQQLMDAIAKSMRVH
jgi:hypothetical protein